MEARRVVLEWNPAQQRGFGALTSEELVSRSHCADPEVETGATADLAPMRAARAVKLG